MALDLRPTQYEDDTAVLRLHGEADAPDHVVLAVALHGFLDGSAHRVILDLDGLRLMTAAGATVITRMGALFAAADRRIAVACPNPVVVRVLELTRAVDVVDVFPTLDEALASVRGPVRPTAEPHAGVASDAGPDRTDLFARTARERDELRVENRYLRAKLRLHPVVAEAQGMLHERYRLPDAAAAHMLLGKSASAFRVNVRTLAAAILAAPRPEDGADRWFPDRVRLPAPDTDALPDATRRADGPTSLATSLLQAALECTDTRLGNVQLADPVRGGLEIRAQHGFDRDFLDRFEHVGTKGSACAAAAADAVRVIVDDVAHDPVFDDANSREAVLAAGARSVQSTPLLTDEGECLGMVSTHSPRIGHAAKPHHLARLDLLAHQAAAWLDWHRRTIVPDALEHLHHNATR